MTGNQAFNGESPEKCRGEQRRGRAEIPFPQDD